jgi:hypothetical protein
VQARGDEAHPSGHAWPNYSSASAREGYAALEGYADFAARVVDDKWAPARARDRLAREGKQVAGYGAPGKGNTLLNYCGIRTDLLRLHGDRNPHKHGSTFPARTFRYILRR